jgi:hypothetical protein
MDGKRALSRMIAGTWFDVQIVIEIAEKKRFPNFFAAGKSSGIIAPGSMADEIWSRVVSHVFVDFRSFIMPTAE